VVIIIIIIIDLTDPDPSPPPVFYDRSTPLHVMPFHALVIFTLLILNVDISRWYARAAEGGQALVCGRC